MTTTDAIKIAKSHGCHIGRRATGGFYVTRNDGFQVCRWHLQAEHADEVVSWIKQRFGA